MGNERERTIAGALSAFASGAIELRRAELGLRERDLFVIAASGIQHD